VKMVLFSSYSASQSHKACKDLQPDVRLILVRRKRPSQWDWPIGTDVS
jgi:hypothetical protein